MRLKVRNSEYALAAAIFAGFAAVVWLFARTYEPGMESPLSSIRRLRNVIVANDQAPGSGALISFAANSQPSFIVIEKEGPGDDRIVAVSRLLPEGEAHNFRVPVEGGLMEGFHYAVLRRDDGDGAFEPESDSVVRDARGAAAITRFLVTSGASR